MKDEKGLAIVADLTAIQVFGDENTADKLIEDIENEVKSVVVDISTAKGRKEIASLAYKVAQSKTALDQLGKDLVADWKNKAKGVDKERKHIRDRLDALRDEVRQPLTEWEESEEKRISAEKLAIEINMLHIIALDENELFDRRIEIERKEEEQRKAEEDRLAKEEADRIERERVERDKLIAEEAQQKAIREAEEKARREKEESERKIKEAKESEDRAKREKQEALEAAEEKRLRDIKEAEERTRREADAKEQARIKAEQEAKREADLKAANKEHRRKINNEVLQSLISSDMAPGLKLSQAQAKLLIGLMATGEIKHVTINY
jgi:hypothetical protein